MIHEIDSQASSVQVGNNERVRAYQLLKAPPESSAIEYLAFVGRTKGQLEYDLTNFPTYVSAKIFLKVESIGNKLPLSPQPPVPDDGKYHDAYDLTGGEVWRSPTIAEEQARFSLTCSDARSDQQSFTASGYWQLENPILAIIPDFRPFLVNMTFHQPGTLASPGAEIGESEEYNIRTLNLNNDEDDALGRPDNADGIIGPKDNDLMKVTLAPPQGPSFENTLLSITFWEIF